MQQLVGRAHARIATSRRGSQRHHTYGTHLGDHTRGIETVIFINDRMEMRACRSVRVAEQTQYPLQVFRSLA